ncbi:MAG: hypothetical protein ACFCVH_01415 [Alphaproteobacteria bacterium]
MRKRASSTSFHRIANCLKPVAIALGIALPAGPAAAEPGFFNLTAPQHNAVMQWTQQLQWAPASNATNYVVEMIVVGHPQYGSWNDPIEFQVPYNRTTWGHNPDTLDVMQGRTIEWQVEACDSNEPNPQLRCKLNTGGARTAHIPLALAALEAPAANATVSTRTPEFSWRIRPGATSYRLLVNGSLAGAPGVCNQTTQVCAHTVTTPIQGAYAIWQVQACYSAGGVTVCGEPLRNPPTSIVRRLNFNVR